MYILIDKNTKEPIAWSKTMPEHRHYRHYIVREVITDILSTYNWVLKNNIFSVEFKKYCMDLYFKYCETAQNSNLIVCIKQHHTIPTYYIAQSVNCARFANAMCESLEFSVQAFNLETFKEKFDSVMEKEYWSCSFDSIMSFDEFEKTY